ncbi:MAG TPA: D-alanyl-D-alanine carboxypeptidase/D-alanyl-D-alanine-endopeptidase [Gemmatimonadales bacterium]|nr:D-alanyl-D-alanine carboxypeptidase/D-alanyl-D-alanine-endopeptidase [Gemmatimonadales bacterium]
MQTRLVALCLCATAAAPPAIARSQDEPQGVLAPSIAPLFRGHLWRHATWGALVVSLTRGDTLFSYHADRRFLPASNAKLFTTAAALHYLGPDFRFVTVLFGDGPVQDSTLYGNLILYGTGDPTFGLDTADLAPFADSVARAGIRLVRGDMVGDASFLGAELAGPGWSADNLDEPFAAPPSALGAAANRIRVVVEPGAGPGAPARVTVEPPTDYYTFTTLVRTGRSRTRTRIDVRRGPSPGVVTLSGTISPRRRSWTTEIVVRQPAVFAAGLLRQLLASRGVTVQGTTRGVTDEGPERARALLAWTREPAGPPFGGTIAVRVSPTLGSLVTMINHRSDNLSAELVFRSIGRSVDGAGTFASGANAVARFLSDEVGIAPSSVQVSDGSGLSLLDEATPRSLVQLLAYERRVPEGDQFWGSLPVAGEGLRRRMEGTAAEGKLRAKTGTLSDASALTGYVTAAGGEELAFSIIVNDPPRINRARAVQDRIGIVLAKFRRADADGDVTGAVR